MPSFNASTPPAKCPFGGSPGAASSTCSGWSLTVRRSCVEKNCDAQWSPRRGQKARQAWLEGWVDPLPRLEGRHTRQGRQLGMEGSSQLIYQLIYPIGGHGRRHFPGHHLLVPRARARPDTPQVSLPVRRPLCSSPRSPVPSRSRSRGHLGRPEG